MQVSFQTILILTLNHSNILQQKNSYLSQKDNEAPN